MNIQLAAQIIQRLSRSGVFDFVVCAGARNAPFVKVLGYLEEKFKVHSSEGSASDLQDLLKVQVAHFFDERAAGYFALGRAKRDHRPVVVVTTSGTAVAELLPSAVEAHYSGVPVIYVTADRPRAYRGSGAPQTIEQVGIFSHYVLQSLDIEKEGDLENLKEQLILRGPIHLNVCFDEPLIDGDVEALGIR